MRDLSQQAAADLRGFVIALGDTNDSLPQGLQCSWTCLTWRQLAVALCPLLHEPDLPSAQVQLAAHLIGFIQDNLWSTTMSADDNFDFEDLALLRAVALRGDDTDARVQTLVGLIGPHLEACLLFKSVPKIFGSVFTGRHHRRVYWAHVTEDPESYVMAGVVASSTPKACIWLESAPKTKGKERMRAEVARFMPKLLGRNPNWRQPSLADLPWHDLELEMDLVHLLGTPKPGEAFAEFFRSAIEDIVETGVGAAYAASWVE